MDVVLPSLLLVCLLGDSFWELGDVCIDICQVDWMLYFADPYTATFSTMVGGVISDIYHAHERNAPMSCFSGAALFGTGLGPLVSGFVEMRVSWRWIFYAEAIASAIFLLLLLLLLKETRGSVLLSSKAKVLNRYYDKLEEAGYYGVVFSAEDAVEKQQVQRIRWKVKSDEERETLVKMVSISCYRPFRELSFSLAEIVY